MTIGRIDTKQLNSQIDLIELASKYTELRGGSSEKYGPCPKCGGDDRFHVHRDGWFMCRHCHEGRGGAIEFTMWLYGCDFITAVGILQGHVSAPAPARRKPEVSPAPEADRSQWQRKVERHLGACQERLCPPLGGSNKEGALGRLYLAKKRRLTGDTARAWSLGFDPAVKVQDQDYVAPAIVLPWYDIEGQLVAIQNRYLDTQACGKTKFTPGSRPSGYLYGEHLLQPDPRKTLVICEGEINALSVWQVAHATRVDVVSIGSKGGRIPDRLMDTIGHYGAVIVWTDEADDTKKVAAKLPKDKVQMMKSPKGQDANDLLRQGDLGKYLCEARLRLCQDEAERMNLLWDLYDAGLLPAGLDTWTAEYVRWLASELNQTVTLHEVGGVWYTGNVVQS